MFSFSPPEATLDDAPKPKHSVSGGGNAPSKAALFAGHGKLRSDGRPHDTGLIRPYRPCPPDFRDRFLEMGWSKELQEHYRTNWRVIRRWIEEAGGEELRAARRRISGGSARPCLRAEFRAKSIARVSAVRKRRRKG